MGRHRGSRRRLPPAPADATIPTPPPPHPHLPPPAGTSSVGFAKWLGYSGIILVLFETPSGFALFGFDGVKLFRPKAVETIWADFIDESKALEVVHLKEFQIFYDKVIAISSAGVGDELAEMITRWLLPGQKLAVGKHEYQRIIGTSLGIHCLFDDAVEELMWGLKNLMKILVPDESLELSDADRLQMSHGMKLVLDRYGFQVDARMMVSPAMKQKLVEDADKYKGMLNMRASYGIYEDITSAYKLRRKALKLLSSMVKEAKEESELHLGCLDDNTEN